MEKLQSANAVLKKQLEDAQLHWRQLLEKTTLAQQVPPTAINWEEKYHNLLQQFQQQDELTNAVPHPENGSMLSQTPISEWEISTTNYEAIH
ncbi:MAG: hypothetical protein HC892_07520 [Saprospiraceae bacterium]|nr:hypothetical protein [Saprospiraceae bacterium]